MSDIDPSRIFTRQQVDDLLSAVINKTLLQVDNATLGTARRISSFNSYSKEDFNDEEQIRLRDFCALLRKHQNTDWMFS